VGFQPRGKGKGKGKAQSLNDLKGKSGEPETCGKERKRGLRGHALLCFLRGGVRRKGEGAIPKLRRRFAQGEEKKGGGRIQPERVFGEGKKEKKNGGRNFLFSFAMRRQKKTTRTLKKWAEGGKTPFHFSISQKKLKGGRERAGGIEEGGGQPLPKMGGRGP